MPARQAESTSDFATKNEQCLAKIPVQLLGVGEARESGPS